MDVNHPETISADSQFVCDICGKILSTASTLKTHRRLKHETKEKINYFKFCRVCHVHIDKDDGAPTGDAEGKDGDETTKATWRGAQLKHFLQHHPEEVFPCPRAEESGCNQQFVHKSVMRHHVATAHTDENRLEREIKGWVFP